MTHPLAVPPSVPPSARLAGRRIRAGAVAVVALLAVLAPDGAREVAPAATLGHPPAAVQRFLDRHHCSTTGFADATPASALVRSAAGRLRLVDLEQGWVITTRRAGTTVLGVCLDRAPGR